MLGLGAPDFKVKKAAMILGYVEYKTIGENLDQVLKSDQMKGYMALSNNILLTDYLEFIWIKDAKVNNGRKRIAFPADLEGKPKKPREDRVKAVSDVLCGFFARPVACPWPGRVSKPVLRICRGMERVQVSLGSKPWHWVVSQFEILAMGGKPIFAQGA